jgi:hypothetical protein
LPLPALSSLSSGEVSIIPIATVTDAPVHFAKVRTMPVQLTQMLW